MYNGAVLEFEGYSLVLAFHEKSRYDVLDDDAQGRTTRANRAVSEIQQLCLRLLCWTYLTSFMLAVGRYAADFDM